MTQKTARNVGYSLSIKRRDENIAFNMELKNLSSIHCSSEAIGRNSENCSYFQVQLLNLREAYIEHKNTFLKSLQKHCMNQKGHYDHSLRKLRLAASEYLGLLRYKVF